MKTYLTQTDLSPTALALVSQFADWDETERIWNGHCPPPSSVKAPLSEGDDFFDVCMEIHNFCEQESLTFSTVAIDTETNEVVVNGIDY